MITRLEFNKEGILKGIAFADTKEEIRQTNHGCGFCDEERMHYLVNGKKNLMLGSKAKVDQGEVVFDNGRIVWEDKKEL